MTVRERLRSVRDYLHKLATNRGLWVAGSAIALFWFADFALGTPLNRDLVDLGGMTVALIFALRTVPNIVEAFHTNPGIASSRFMFGTTMFAAGFFFQRAWAFAVRWNDRPTWMIESPINGFIAFWMMCSFLLILSGATERPTASRQSRWYYTAVALVVGILIGALMSRGTDFVT